MIRKFVSAWFFMGLANFARGVGYAYGFTTDALYQGRRNGRTASEYRHYRDSFAENGSFSKLIQGFGNRKAEPVAKQAEPPKY